jgi:2-haloacid dehalogenase
VDHQGFYFIFSSYSAAMTLHLNQVSTMRQGAVMFDLLTALLDSWSVWTSATGGDVQAAKTWRMHYLKLTYGQGSYAPYEDLVRQAARECGYPAAWADALDAQWSQLRTWPGVKDALQGLLALPVPPKLGIATNCSERLGQIAAACVGVRFDVIVTSARAGFYKPHPAPYTLCLQELGVARNDCLFVAGSGYDLFGTQAVGLRTFWHNISGLTKPEGAPAPWREERSLANLPQAYTEHLSIENA